MTATLRHINVLDRGYVRLITWTPANMVDIQDHLLHERRALSDLSLDADLTAVNAARASFGAEVQSLSEKDIKLLHFLADAEPVAHSSPFRHAHVSLEICAPLPIARQWWRHAIGAGTTEEGTPWSELSRRYVRGDITYHIPSEWRTKPDNAKQGSGAPITDPVLAGELTNNFANACDLCLDVYDAMISRGVAPEQARMVLPQGVFTTWRWTPSIHALANFLVHRLAKDAQWEIRQYAEAVVSLVAPIFPHAIDALVNRHAE